MRVTKTLIGKTYRGAAKGKAETMQKRWKIFFGGGGGGGGFDEKWQRPKGLKCFEASKVIKFLLRVPPQPDFRLLSKSLCPSVSADGRPRR